MTAVYLLRHPETIWNVAQRYQGRLEAPLSATGCRQAHRVASVFAGQGLTAVVSSPLQRALALAKELARSANAPLSTDQRLTEVGQGVWEGLTLPEIEWRYPELHQQWYARPDTVRFPLGETLQEVEARCLSALGDMYRRYPAGHVAVVTHSVVIQVAVAAALSLHLRHIHRIRVSNASITTLCGVEPPGSLLALNLTEPLYHSPVASAAAQDCVSWKRRRIAS